MADDDFFIRRFAHARDTGDKDLAGKIWEDACVRKFDLVRGLVAGHRFPGGQALSPADIEDAEIEGMVRILQMGANFRGTTGAEFRAAIKKAVWFACMDVGRDVLAHEQRAAGSIDQRYDDSDDAGPYSKALERYLREQDDHARSIEEDERWAADAIELLHWAIAQVENDNYREMLELTHVEKLSGDQIAERLDIDLNNVYKRRERGIKKLEEILRDHRS